MKFDYYNLQNNQFRKDELDEVSEEEKGNIRKLFPEKEGTSLKVKEVLGGGSE